MNEGAGKSPVVQCRQQQNVLVDFFLFCFVLFFCFFLPFVLLSRLNKECHRKPTEIRIFSDQLNPGLWYYTYFARIKFRRCP